MIRKPRTQRDNQQWIVDLAMNMRGRVQNFERDDWETSQRAHNYRMLPKMWREAASRMRRSLPNPAVRSASLCQTHPALFPSGWAQTAPILIDLPLTV